MKTNNKFKIVLKDLMKTNSIDEISVTLLCSKCGCHRQTFYYHYQDIYDLIADIFLTEKLDALENAKDIKTALYALRDYTKENLAFLHACYISSARDLPDDFIFGTLRNKLQDILSKNRKDYEIKKLSTCRDASRRFARIVSYEFGEYFRQDLTTPEKYSRRITKFIDRSLEVLLPTIIRLSQDEEK